MSEAGLGQVDVEDVNQLGQTKIVLKVVLVPEAVTIAQILELLLEPTFPIWALSGYTAGSRGREYIIPPQESKPLCVRNSLNAAPSGVKTTIGVTDRPV